MNRSAWRILPILTLPAILVTACIDDDPAADGGADTGADASDDAGPLPDGSTPDAGGMDAGAPDVPEADASSNLKNPVEVDVSGVFAPGTAVRDGYAGQTATVDANGKISIRPHGNGVLLLEADEAPGAEAGFSWDNVTVYFAVTDRFRNGDPSNDQAYGRESDGADEIGTFHGGDLAGLTQSLDYIADLGATAIWITPIVQQIGGWIPSGTNTGFRNYPYMGYWAKDFTVLDANWGTEEELHSFVDAAHSRGIRVIVDVVLNHPGYASPADVAEIMPSAIDPGWATWTPGSGQTLYNIYDLIDFDAQVWDDNWWGTTWVRACLGVAYSCPQDAAVDPEKGSVGFLPDFKTEDFRPSGLPPLLANKADTNATDLGGTATVREYLVAWQTRWVRDFGIDGFRVDTAKHVEKATWAALEEAATTALAEWKAANPTKKIDDAPFWMTAEVFPPPKGLDAPVGSPERDQFMAFYTDGKFDSMINFDFQTQLARNPSLVDDANAMDGVYQSYADTVNTNEDMEVLTYISSHDKALWYDVTAGDMDKQYKAGTWLMMAPGGVQVFYGDETARGPGPSGGDSEAKTRSDMNWDAIDAELLAHWRRLGQFRARHVAVGAGAHRRITRASGYAFARDYDRAGVQDEVMVVVLDPSELN